jgi:hypothetical protein
VEDTRQVLFCQRLGLEIRFEEGSRSPGLLALRREYRDCAELEDVVERSKEEEGLIEAAGARNIDDNADEKPVKITAVDSKNNTRTTLGSQVTSSSRADSPKATHPGDAIELSVLKTTMSKALEFYKKKKCTQWQIQSLLCLLVLPSLGRSKTC